MSTLKPLAPMLADTYTGWPLKSPGYVLVQPKLDGLRAFPVTADGLISRDGNRFRSVPHIEEALKGFFEKYPNLVLDGELYNHRYADRFHELSGKIRRHAPCPEAQLYVYDVFDIENPGRNQFDRQALLDILAGEFAWTSPNKVVHRVPTEVAGSHEELELFKLRYLAAGYEGAIARLKSYPYELDHRSHGLLKLKQFEDDEFEILQLVEGKGAWAGTAKIVKCKLKGTRAGIKKPWFFATVVGTKAQLAEVLANAKDYVGGYATVNFQGYGKDKPRHPRAKALYKKGEDRNG